MKHTLQFIIGFLVCFALRLVPGRPPNVEPILTSTMPFAKHMGPLAGFLFAFLNIIIFDLFTSGIGSWTFITGITYGLIGIGAWYTFRNGKATALGYAAFALPATIVYDLITGVIPGPLVWGMSLTQSISGQIPFTINHVLGNLILALVLSPLVDRWIARNTKLEFPLFSPKVTTHS